MPVNLNVQVTGLDKLQKAFKQAPTIANQHLNTAIKQSVFTLLANARIAAPVDQGFLRNSGMVTSFEILKGVLENRAPYALYVHEGTRPHYVPLSAIKDWSDRHGIPAFLVQRSIMRKGTKPKPFFKDSIEASQESIDKYFQKALDNIINELSK